MDRFEEFTQLLNKILADKECGEIVGSDFIGQFGVMQSVVKQHLGSLVIALAWFCVPLLSSSRTP